MSELLVNTDILIDATQRPDPSRIVIPNELIGRMPKHAVLVDLSVDPYNCELDPPEVKAIEGMPQGNLDQYVFLPTDSVYEHIPNCVSVKHRRHAVSCYSWPGIHPKGCMATYGGQIRPVLRTILERGGIQQIKTQGRYFERAIGRAMLSNWEGNKTGFNAHKPEKEDKG
jgi:alanine dehydrogenase